MGKYCKEDNLKKQLNLTFSLLKVTIRESEKGFCYTEFKLRVQITKFFILKGEGL